MNNSVEKDVFISTCKVAQSGLSFLSQFPGAKYERNRIAVLLINCMLLFSTISLNGLSVITIRKSSQLRNKVCYFVILLQSVVDLGVGVVSIPLFICYLIFPFLHTANCILITLALRTSYVLPGLSIVTLSAMAIERYIGVLHPFAYRTKVTSKRILIYVCGNGLAFIAVLAYSFRDPNFLAIYARLLISIFFILIGFVYTRIYLVIRKLIRSEKRPTCESSGSQVKRQIIRESRRARSCFLVVICFVVFLLPIVITRFVFTVGSVEYTVYFNWSLTMIILNSSINSLIFFWTKKLLRKEARETVNTLCSQLR